LSGKENKWLLSRVKALKPVFLGVLSGKEKKTKETPEPKSLTPKVNQNL
jgi:hypothetical protein